MSATQSKVAELLEREGDVISDEEQEILQLAASIDTEVSRDVNEQLDEALKPVRSPVSMEGVDDIELAIAQELEQEEHKQKLYIRQSEEGTDGGTIDFDVDENTTIEMPDLPAQKVRKRRASTGDASWYLTTGAFGNWLREYDANADTVAGKLLRETDGPYVADICERFEDAPKKVKAKVVNLLNAPSDLSGLSVFTKMYFDWLMKPDVPGLIRYYCDENENGHKTYNRSTASVQAKQMEHLVNVLGNRFMTDLGVIYKDVYFS